MLDVKRRAEVLGHLEVEREQVAVLAFGLYLDVADVGQFHVKTEVGIVLRHLGYDGVHHRHGQLDGEVARVDEHRKVGVIVQRETRRVPYGRGERLRLPRAVRAEQAAQLRRKQFLYAEARDRHAHTLAEKRREVCVKSVVHKVHRDELIALGAVRVVAVDFQRRLHGVGRHVEIGVQLHREVGILVAAHVPRDVDVKVGADKRRAAQSPLDGVKTEEHIRKRAKVDVRARVAPEADVYHGAQPQGGFVHRRHLGVMLGDLTALVHIVVGEGLGRREGLVDRKPQVAQRERDGHVAEESVFAHHEVLVKGVASARICLAGEALDAAHEHIGARAVDHEVALAHLSAEHTLIILIFLRQYAVRAVRALDERVLVRDLVRHGLEGVAVGVVVLAFDSLALCLESAVFVTHPASEHGVPVRVEVHDLIAVAKPRLLGRRVDRERVFLGGEHDRRILRRSLRGRHLTLLSPHGREGAVRVLRHVGDGSEIGVKAVYAVGVVAFRADETLDEFGVQILDRAEVVKAALHPKVDGETQ